MADLNKLRDDIENIQDETRLSVDFATEFVKELGKSSQTVKEISKTFFTTNKLTQNLLTHIDAASKGELQLKKFSQDLAKSKAIQAEVTREIKKLTITTGAIERDINDAINKKIREQTKLRNQINVLLSAGAKTSSKEIKDREKQISQLKEEIKNENYKLTINRDLTAYLNEQQINVDNILEGYEKIVEENEKLKQQQKEINKTAGLTGLVLDSLFKTRFTKGLATFLGLDEAKKAMNAYIEEQVKGGKSTDSFTLKTAALSKGLGGLKKGLISSLKDPVILITATVALVKELYKIGIQTDEWATKFSRSMAMSKSSAIDLVTNFRSMALLSGDLLMSSEALMKANFDLNESQDIAVRRTEEELKLQVKLRNIDIASASKLNMISKINTKDHNKYVESILQGAFYSMKSNKIQFEAQNILEEIGKISSDILITFSKNPEALGRAVAEAKNLGLTLNEVDTIGNHLLDFQSSITSEMQAEVLLGKQFNLEQMRAAALFNDQATLQAEIKKNLPSLEEFKKLNSIEREAYAEIFGLNKQQLADSVLRLEAERKFGDISKLSLQEISKLAQEQGTTEGKLLLDKYAQLSVQDRFNAAMTRLKDIVARLVGGPMGKFLEMLASALEKVDKLFSGVGKIGKALGLGAMGTSIVGGLSTLIIGGGLARMLLKGSTPFTPMYTFDVAARVSDFFRGGNNPGRGLSMMSPFYQSPTSMYAGGKGAPLKYKGKIPAGSKKGMGFTKLTKGLAAAGLLLEAGLIGKDIYDEVQKGEDLGTAIKKGGMKNLGTILGGIVGGIGGAFLGPGGALIGASLGAGIGSFFNPSEEENLPQMARGGVLTKPTKVIAGEAGKEAIIPLKKDTVVDVKPIVDAINRLIAVTESGKNIMFDTTKVSVALAKNNYRS